MKKKHDDRVSEEIRRRILVATWAYAYEILSENLVPDHVYDEEAQKIDLSISTSYSTRDNSEIDKWFRENFKPNTGSWVWNHPDKKGLHRYYEAIKRNQKERASNEMEPEPVVHNEESSA